MRRSRSIIFTTNFLFELILPSFLFARISPNTHDQSRISVDDFSWLIFLKLRRIIRLLWHLTLISKVLAYDSGGFMGVISTFRFRLDCDINLEPGLVRSYSKKHIDSQVYLNPLWRQTNGVMWQKFSHKKWTPPKTPRYESGGFVEIYQVELRFP